jgi:hypothetical protein
MLKTKNLYALHSFLFAAIVRKFVMIMATGKLLMLILDRTLKQSSRMVFVQNVQRGYIQI